MHINDLFAKDGYVRAEGRMMHDMYLMQVKRSSGGSPEWRQHPGGDQNGVPADAASNTSSPVGS